MFDYHLHSRVSFDSACAPEDIVSAAEKAGLKEICFTDHYDFNDVYRDKIDIFTISDYQAAYEGLASQNVKIRRGVEFGLTTWNQNELGELLKKYDFDFVIGSAHYAGGYDPYFKEFWTHNGIDTAFERHLLQSLECVKAHNNFDVLGHLNYVCKSAHNPTGKPLYYSDYADICDEIMKTLADKGIGMEINTSGVDRVGDFLPSIDFIKRFRSLGGEIITVGSDAHDGARVGQYINEALEIAKEVFGYVCTFEKRKPIFHKL
ncbi:MAG: histidinol-phosphatase HisJ family protein [Ruminococcaceae bacterium]|nr:histidinol-phosphatase HisJ family protein [Oscillospiraceae bacterium]